MSEFKPGDIVRLKSGGPSMTVVEVPDQLEIRCAWFCEWTRDYKGGLFVVAALEKP